MTLFTDEKIITKSNNNQVILTSHRICYEYKEWGRAYNQSIMLEHITSCENHNLKNKSLVILAIVFAIIGFICISNNEDDAFGIFSLIAIGLTILYWLTRKNFIIIGSPSTKMSINVKGMSREKVLSFINDVEQTKHQRLLTINSRN